MSNDQTSYCRDCGSKCCRYFTVPLTRPEDADDFDAMKWYLLHEGVSVYIDDEGDWYVNVTSPCSALGQDGLCRIYSVRPDICRVHTNEICEKDDSRYDFREHFFTVEALMDYARRFLDRKEEVRRKKSMAAKRAWQRRRPSGESPSAPSPPEDRR